MLHNQRRHVHAGGWRPPVEAGGGRPVETAGGGREVGASGWRLSTTGGDEREAGRWPRPTSRGVRLRGLQRAAAGGSGGHLAHDGGSRLGALLGRLPSALPGELDVEAQVGLVHQSLGRAARDDQATCRQPTHLEGWTNHVLSTSNGGRRSCRHMQACKEDTMTLVHQSRPLPVLAAPPHSGVKHNADLQKKTRFRLASLNGGLNDGK